jgi:hypothetical protein
MKVHLLLILPRLVVITSSSLLWPEFGDGILSVPASFEEDKHIWHHSRSFQISVPDGVVLETCVDATDLFSRAYDRSSNGTNYLKTFFECACEGDFPSAFTVNCSRSNFCFTARTNTEETQFEVCMKQVTIKHAIQVFPDEVNDGSLQYMLTKSTSCYEYEKGGPTTNGKMCSHFNYDCISHLQERNSLAFADATAICSSQDECRPLLQAVNFSREEATDLCPRRTLNDKLCKTYVGDYASESGPNGVYTAICEERFGNNFQLNPDCSNVESCAVPSCQRRDLDSQGNGIVLVYPLCAGIELSANETPPAPALLLKCQQNDQVTMKEFDNCIYHSGYLSQEMSHECRECLSFAISSKQAYENRGNCTAFGDAICSVFKQDCTTLCGPCSLPGYNMLQCLIQEGPELAVNKCSLTCPPPEGVGNGWIPIFKDKDVGSAMSRAGGRPSLRKSILILVGLLSLPAWC